MRRIITSKTLSLHPLWVFCVVLFVATHTACRDSVPAKELIHFVKDEANGYTKTFLSPYGSQWKITLAPAEFMALNSIKKNRPDEKEYEETRQQYTDLTYFIIETQNEDRIQGLACENVLASGCDAPEYKALLCQEINSLKAENTKEFMVAFPKELLECGTEIGIYLKHAGDGSAEEIGRLDTRQMKTLPHVTTN